MKTIRTMILISAVAFGAIATAVEKPKMDVYPIEAEKVIISLSNNSPAYFEVSVKEVNGETVYYKQTNNKLTDYKKIYDFSSLNEGHYEFALKVNNTKVKRNFEVSKGDLVFGESKVSYDPYVDLKDGILKISYLNFEGEKLSLKIYGDEGLVYQANLGNEFVINAGYNLSKIQDGGYTVVIEGSDVLLSYNFEK